MIRKFRIGGEGRVVVLPRHLSTGGANMRLAEGDTLELDSTRVDRFVRRSLANGDLVEVTNDAGPSGEKGKSK